MAVNSLYAVLAAGVTGERVVVGYPLSPANRLRLLGYRLDISGDATIATAGPVTFQFWNAHRGAFHLIAAPFLPQDAPTVPNPVHFTTGWVDLGEGILFEHISESLDMAFSTSLTSGLVTISVLVSEEEGGTFPVPRITDVAPTFVSMSGGEGVTVVGEWFSPDLMVTYTDSGSPVLDLSVQPTVATFTSSPQPLPGGLTYGSMIGLTATTASGTFADRWQWAYDPDHLPRLTALDITEIEQGDATAITGDGLDLAIGDNGTDNVASVGFFTSPPPDGKPYPSLADYENYGLTGWADTTYGPLDDDTSKLTFSTGELPPGTYYVVPGTYVEDQPVFHGTASSPLLTVTAP